MSYQCEIVTQPERTALAVRTRTSVQDLPNLMGATYGRLAAYMGSQGQAPAGMPYAAYYNMDMQDLDLEMGFPIAAALEGEGDMQPTQIPGGRQASCTHKGPYSAIEDAYNALGEFIAAEMVEPTGVAYEFYLNDPNETAPEELLTQIFFPLK